MLDLAGWGNSPGVAGKSYSMKLLLFVAALCYAAFGLSYLHFKFPAWLFIVAFVWLTLAVLLAVGIARLPHDETNPRFELGHCNGKPARRNRKTGEVQFVIHPAGRVVGTYTYEQDHWIAFHESWWSHFTPQADAPAERVRSARLS